jgi:DNA-binding transcriptional LysR family regulator
MTSQQIEYLLILAEERSFSKASQRLYVTQPSLSQFVKNLENELHTQLFDRSTSPIRLTPSGDAYVKAAKKIKSIEEELNNQIADLTNLQSGQLNIGTSPFRASCLLPKSIAEFHKKYPGVELHINENQMIDLEEATLEGMLDLYIGTGPMKTSFMQRH